MPGYDGTGPRGMGSMTGGGSGFCAVPVGRVASKSFIGRFFGHCGGRGWRHLHHTTGARGWQGSGLAPSDEKEALKKEAEFLNEELASLQSRISSLEKAKEE